jgi:hypothetical protein
MNSTSFVVVFQYSLNENGKMFVQHGCPNFCWYIIPDNQMSSRRNMFAVCIKLSFFSFLADMRSSLLAPAWISTSV